MPSLRERILHALLDLDLDAFKRFKWYLRDLEYVAGFQPLTKRAVQDAAPEDVVDQIVENFPGKECLIMATILPKVNRHDLAPRFGDTPTGKGTITENTLLAQQMLDMKAEFEKRNIASNQQMAQEMRDLKSELEKLKTSSNQQPVFKGATLSRADSNCGLAWKASTLTPAVTPAVTPVTPAVTPAVTPVSPAQVSGPPVSPRNRKRTDLLQHSCQLYLDENTANEYLELSEENRKVTRGRDQGRPQHEDRFTYAYQVLSREPLSDRCYFEVEWRAQGGDFRRGNGVGVAVSYKDISRVGWPSGFGLNKRSWMLGYSVSSYIFRRNSTDTVLSGRPSTVGGVARGVWGVDVDQIKGSVSFYSVEDTTMTLLYTVKHTFTQPLYAGIEVNWSGSTAEVCKICSGT